MLFTSKNTQPIFLFLNHVFYYQVMRNLSSKKIHCGVNNNLKKKKLKYADSVSELEEEILDDSDSEMRKGMMILRMDDEKLKVLELQKKLRLTSNQDNLEIKDDLVSSYEKESFELSLRHRSEKTQSMH